MSAHKPSASRAFFLEIVLDLVIFTICATICLQVFAEARLESARSAALSQLGIESQRVAELFKDGVTDPAALAERTDAHLQGNTLHWYYDQKFAPTSSEKPFYALDCIIDGSQPVKKAKITLTEYSASGEGLLLLDFEVSRYVRAVGGGS